MALALPQYPWSNVEFFGTYSLARWRYLLLRLVTPCHLFVAQILSSFTSDATILMDSVLWTNAERTRWIWRFTWPFWHYNSCKKKQQIPDLETHPSKRRQFRNMKYSSSIYLSTSIHQLLTGMPQITGGYHRPGRRCLDSLQVLTGAAIDSGAIDGGFLK